MKRIFLTIALMLGVSSVDAGGSKDGNDLLSEFKKCDMDGTSLYCGSYTGYIIGISDTYEFIQDWKGFDPTICTPGAVTVGQLKAIVRKYLDNNPELLHLDAAGLVLTALRKAFPCP